MRNFEQLKQAELKVTTDKIRYHAVWPNMERNYSVSFAQAAIPSLRRSRSHVASQELNPRQTKSKSKSKGFHLFKDMFNGDNFSSWMLAQVSDLQLAVDYQTYESVLQFAARDRVGAGEGT